MGAQAVAAEVELVHSTLDDWLILAAAFAGRFSSPFVLGTVAASGLWSKSPRFEIQSAGTQHHSRRQSCHTRAQ